jgi:hypothetical protein
MIVLLHVLIALSSMVYTTYLFFRPTKRNFHINYALVGLTFASGIYLVISSHAALVPACEAGLVYLGAVTAGMVAAQYRLAHQKTK